MTEIFTSPYNLTKKIIVQTRKGSNIENEQYNHMTTLEKSYLKEKFQREFPEAVLRNYATDIYNCHGLTFASRRTYIWDPNEIWKIIREDNYVEIFEKNVLPGDVILYIDTKGDVEHSGLVISKPNTTFFVPMIVSKWGKGPEYIHFANNCPYTQIRKYYRVNDGY